MPIYQKITRSTAALFMVMLLVSMTLLSGPKAKFDDKKHDFGQKEFRSKVQHDFKLTNEGDEPLIITGHFTACPCSQIFYSKEPIFPGAETLITIKYDSTKKGKFTRKIDIHTNTGKTTLTIKGEITDRKKKVNPLTGEEIE